MQGQYRRRVALACPQQSILSVQRLELAHSVELDHRKTGF